MLSVRFPFKDMEFCFVHCTFYGKQNENKSYSS